MSVSKVPSKQLGFEAFEGSLLGESVKITNLDITTANTEFSHILEDGLKHLMVRSRDNATLQYSFVENETNSNFMTLKGAGVLSLSGLNFSGKVFYVRADKTGIVEIQEIY